MITKQFLKVVKVNESTLLMTLNRPEKRNALNLRLMEEIYEVFDALQQSPYRVLILTGEGKAFCAGLDLEEAANESLVEKMAQHVARVLTTIYQSRLVTIAAVQGAAVAGGAGLVAACDLSVMSHEAVIGFPEVRKGLIAAQVSVLLKRQIAMRYVRELLLTGELIDSKKALRIGLVNEIVDHEVLMESASTLAGKVILGGEEAIKESKSLLNQLDPSDFFHDLETALSFHQTARHSLEAKKRIHEFLKS